MQTTKPTFDKHKAKSVLKLIMKVNEEALLSRKKVQYFE